jgi:hypothetical protein
MMPRPGLTCELTLPMDDEVEAPILLDQFTLSHKIALGFIASIFLVHIFWYFHSGPHPPIFFSHWLFHQSWCSFARIILSPLIYPDLTLGTWFQIVILGIVVFAIVFAIYSATPLAFVGCLLYAYAAVLLSGFFFPAPTLGRRTMWFFFVYASKLFPTSDLRAGDFALRIPLSFFTLAYAYYIVIFANIEDLRPFLLLAAFAHILLFVKILRKRVQRR